MNATKISRRQFLKQTSVVVGATLIAGPGPVWAKRQAGAMIDPMKLITTSATTDPARPEMARLICQAFKKIGWEVEAMPIAYQQNIQKVVLEHDYDMWLVHFDGVSIRIDPNVFIYQAHHSSQYKKGGYNFTGYNNTDLDQLAEAQQNEMDQTKRRDLVYQAQAIIHADQPENVVLNPKMTQGYRSDSLHNLVPMMGEGIGSFWTDINMETSRSDGYVRTGVTIPMKSLNPISVSNSDEFKELRMIYDRLFRVAPDGQAKPWAAESLEMVDSQTMDVRLRKGMQFHDGQPVTSEDVRFTFNYYKKWKAPFFTAALENVEAVTVTDPLTVRIRLIKPYSPFLSNVLAAIFIIPKHIWKDIPEKVKVTDPLNFPNEKPIGSGPFKFEYWDRGRELKLSAFKQHFQPPKCAGNLMIVYGSHDAMTVAIEKGECDRTRFIIKPSLMEDLNRVKGCVGESYPSHGFYDLGYHTRRPPLDDQRFRKALAHVVPKELMRDTVLGGHASIGASVIAPANQYWHNEAIKPYPTDIRLAKKILAEAGYTWDSNGKLHFPKT